MGDDDWAMSRTLAAGSWVAATAVATTISWAGVSIVTGEVTDGRAPATSAAEVAALVPASGDAGPAHATGPSPPAESAAASPSPPVTTGEFAARAPRRPTDNHALPGHRAPPGRRPTSGAPRRSAVPLPGHPPPPWPR